MKPHRRKDSGPPAVWVREDRIPTLPELAWLASPEGQTATREMDREHPADTPARIARWRERLEPDRVAAAWQQVLLRRKARDKFTRADEMLFDRVALEQATDETVAAYKASRFQGVAQVADLCCGLGGDAIALAARARVTAIDWSPVRVAMARHNAGVYGRPIAATADDAAIARPEADAVHIDPDRRPAGARRHDVQAASPDAETLRRVVQHYQHAAVKLSPGADVASLAFEAEIELVSHAGQCRQAIAWTGRFHQANRRATILPSGESIAAGPADDLAWPQPRPVETGLWLFEPDPAVVRANLVGLLARRYGLAPVDPLIAYLVGDGPIDSGLAEGFQVLATADFSARAVRQLLARHNIGLIEIKTRGFAVRPEDVRRLARPAGRQAGVLLLTRTGGQARALLARRGSRPG